MTKGEARSIYLRYLGEATVNGENKSDLDLADTFNKLLNSAMIYVASSFPRRMVVHAEKDWDAPEDFVSLIRTYDKNGNTVSYYRKGDRRYIFEEDCDVEYTHKPETVSANASDNTELDIDSRYAELVPLKLAVDAALSREEYAYKVSYLTEQYNALAQALADGDIPTFRRVF